MGEKSATNLAQDRHVLLLVQTLHRKMAPGYQDVYGDWETGRNEIRSLADHRFLVPLVAIWHSRTVHLVYQQQVEHRKLQDVIRDVAVAHWEDLVSDLASEETETRQTALEALTALQSYRDELGHLSTLPREWAPVFDQVLAGSDRPVVSYAEWEDRMSSILPHVRHFEPGAPGRLP
jgi:hypothetical protein